MALVYGGNVVISILQNGEYSVIGCGRTKGLTTTTSTGIISTIGSGLWEEIRGISNAWECKVTGLVSYDTNLSLYELRYMQFALTPISIQILSQQNNGLGALYNGKAIITSVEEEGTYNDLDVFTVSLKGSGKLTPQILGRLLSDDNGNLITTPDKNYIIA